MDKGLQMKNAIILHGISESREKYLGYPGSMSNFAWYPVLQWDLTRRGILTQTPEMPTPYLPDMNYDEWAKIISRMDINENTVLVGHSCGGGFWLKYLSENPGIKIRQLVLVAPWIDTLREHPTFFADFELAPDLPTRAGQIDLFISSDDDLRIQKSFEKIVATYGDKIIYHKFSDREHFSNPTVGFPEIFPVVKLD
jgi:predicted alpha/beta hydrolase family esterase